jgi:hypothetical protein
MVGMGGILQAAYILMPPLPFRFRRFGDDFVPYSLGLSATSQQYFSLRTNQQPANSTFLSEQTSNQPTVLFSQNKPAPAISHQPNEQTVARVTFNSFFSLITGYINQKQGYAF